MPALVLPETPCEWVELYILAQNQPAKLLFYVDPKTCYGLEKRQPPLPQVGISGLNRLYALRLLGDTGGIEIIPALQSISAQYRQGGVSYSSKKQIAHVIDLTIERIRYRAKGRDAYIREMIRWVQSPEPPWEKSDEVIDYVERVVEAARAEAALMKLLQHPDAKVRYAAAKAIESSGTFRILPELEQRADQETVESVRRALVQAIERIRGQ